MQPSRIRSLVLGAACAAAVVPLVALAQQQGQEQPRQKTESSTVAQQQPVDQTQSSPDGGGERRRFRSRFPDNRPDDRGDGRGGDNQPPAPEQQQPQPPIDPLGPGQFFRPVPPFEAPTPEEWDKAMAFMKEHAPKRWALHLNQPEQAQQPIREFMFVRYRQLERVRNADRDIYEIQLRRFGIEDEIYALAFPAFPFGEGRALTEEEVSKLREKVTAQIDTHLEERELRLQRLREVLKREEGLLASDKSQRDGMISQRVTNLQAGRGMSRMSGGFSPRPGGLGAPRQDGGMGPGGFERPVTPPPPP